MLCDGPPGRSEDDPLCVRTLCTGCIRWWHPAGPTHPDELDSWMCPACQSGDRVAGRGSGFVEKVQAYQLAELQEDKAKGVVTNQARMHPEWPLWVQVDGSVWVTQSEDKKKRDVAPEWVCGKVLEVRVGGFVTLCCRAVFRCTLLGFCVCVRFLFASCFSVFVFGFSVSYVLLFSLLTHCGPGRCTRSICSCNARMRQA
jgi:hypothetical protein